MIMPVLHDNWEDMLAHIEKQRGAPNASNFRFLNTYFMEDMLEEEERKEGKGELARELEDIPRHLHMTRHVVRSRQVS